MVRLFVCMQYLCLGLLLSYHVSLLWLQYRPTNKKQPNEKSQAHCGGRVVRSLGREILHSGEPTVTLKLAGMQYPFIIYYYGGPW